MDILVCKLNLVHILNFESAKKINERHSQSSAFFESAACALTSTNFSEHRLRLRFHIVLICLFIQTQTNWGSTVPNNLERGGFFSKIKYRTYQVSKNNNWIFVRWSKYIINGTSHPFSTWEYSLMLNSGFDKQNYGWAYMEAICSKNTIVIMRY